MNNFKQMAQQVGIIVLMIILAFTFYVAPLAACAVGIDILISYAGITLLHSIILIIMMLVSITIWLSVVLATYYEIKKNRTKK